MPACPSEPRLKDLLDEHVPPAERAVLEDHLSHCETCQQTLLDLSGDASEWERLESLLHSPASDATTPTDVLNELKKTQLPGRLQSRHGRNVPPPNIPGYTIPGELGRGGMAVVYRARQLGLNREVALKMIPAGGHASPELHARFRHEAEIVARLQHPNIVQIHEVGEHEGLPFFSMELVSGGSLKERLR